MGKLNGREYFKQTFDLCVLIANVNPKSPSCSPNSSVPKGVHHTESAKVACVCASERLLSAALQLFAEKGFGNTSIRDLAHKAQVNVSAISYYFKDKVGLYKAAFSRSAGCVQPGGLRCGPEGPVVILSDALTLREQLGHVLRDLIEPLKQGEVVGWHVRLRMREMLESTGLWEQEIVSEIAPAQRALEHCLCRELGLKTADERVQRLAFSITGMGIHLLVSRDVVQSLHPQLLDSASAIDQYIEQLTDYAVAMVNVEKQRAERV